MALGCVSTTLDAYISGGSAIELITVITVIFPFSEFSLIPNIECCLQVGDSVLKVVFVVIFRVVCNGDIAFEIYYLLF